MDLKQQLENKAVPVKRTQPKQKSRRLDEQARTTTRNLRAPNSHMIQFIRKLDKLLESNYLEQDVYESLKTILEDNRKSRLIRVLQTVNFQSNASIKKTVQQMKSILYQ